MITLLSVVLASIALGMAQPELEVEAMLDAWHLAAADADEAAYFGAFSGPEAVFMGTDATERWLRDEFREYAHPYFDRGRAWTFEAKSRHVIVNEDATVAWFDEALDTPARGEWRGSGVVVKVDDAWKVAHYNLTIPIPNDIAGNVIDQIAAHFDGEAVTAEGNAGAGVLFRTLDDRGRTYRYAVYVPRAYEAGTPMPAILFLHGLGESGTDGSLQTTVGLPPAVLARPGDWPFIVIMPQKPGYREAWVDHAGVVFAMLDTAMSEFSIDEDRVYLTGLSQGGSGTWHLAAMQPERFAAIAPVCGYVTPPGSFEGGDRAWKADEDELSRISHSLAEMPVWAFHGDADAVVPYSESVVVVDALKAAGGSPRLTVVEGAGHNSWDAAYRKHDLASWFLEHRRSER